MKEIKAILEEAEKEKKFAEEKFQEGKKYPASYNIEATYHLLRATYLQNEAMFEWMQRVIKQ